MRADQRHNPMTRPTPIADSVAPNASPGAEPSDDQLMARAASDEHEAFAMLVRRHMPQLLGYCSKYVCDVRLGEELAQDTWLKLWAYRARYRAQGKFRVLLYTSARNLCRSHARDTGRRSRWWGELSTPDPGSDTESDSQNNTQLDALLAREQEQRIQEAMAHLKPKLREALLLRFDQELDYSEIAAILGRSESTVRSRIFHGLRQLRMQHAGDTP